MAVFIKKEHLGSGPPPRTRIMKNPNLSSLPGFQEVQRQMEEASAQRAEERKEKWDGNAEVQTRKRMTQEERSRGAVERVAKNLKEYEDQKTGTDTSYEKAREKAVEIARKVDRQKGGE